MKQNARKSNFCERRGKSKKKGEKIREGRLRSSENWSIDLRAGHVPNAQKGRKSLLPSYLEEERKQPPVPDPERGNRTGRSSVTEQSGLHYGHLGKGDWGGE